MRFVRTVTGLLLFVAAAWAAGRLLLQVQLPDRTGRHDAFPDPMDDGISLREVFESLPDEGGAETDLRLLEDNTIAWLERWRLLDSARRRLDISYFILKQDVFGVAFLGHLVKKAQEGLEIRVLLDAMGTKMSRDFRGNDYLDALVNTERVRIRMYRPLPFRYLDAFLTVNPAAIFVSDHDKILLADRQRALIGGRNISTEYFTPPEDDPEVFLDTDLVVFGPAIGAAVENIFESHYASGEAHEVVRETVDLKDSTADLLLAYAAMDAWLNDRPLPPEVERAIRERELSWVEELQKMPGLRGAIRRERPRQIEAEVRLIDSRTRLVEADDHITRTAIRLVRSARREIFIQSPYLVLPKEGADVLEEAGRRGVRITILTNSPLSSDNAMSQGIFLEQWPELLARVPGMRIFVAGDRHNLHGKLAVFDRRLALVGTYNLDPLSMALNSELAAAAWSEAFAEELLEWRERRIGEGAPKVFEYRVARDPQGQPRRDARGKVVVEFGPEDHIDPQKMEPVARYRDLFRWGGGLKRSFPFF